MKRKKRIISGKSSKRNSKRTLSKKSTQKNTLRTLLIGFIIFISLGIWATIYFQYLKMDLPSTAQLETFEPLLVSKVYSRDGVLLKEFYYERRELVPLSDISEHIINAILITEDHKFFDHWGVNSGRFVKALLLNISAMSYKQGFSTITMQLARNLFLTREKTITRKLKEVLVALEIEKTYSKNEILEMYLNQVLFGHNTWGVKSGAKLYFNKTPKELTLAEAALMAAQPKAPTTYSPINNPENALSRRNNVILKNMLKSGLITKSEYEEACKTPLPDKLYRSEEEYGKAPYFTEYLRQAISEKEDELGIDLYRDGLTIYTTLDSRVQAIAEREIKAQLRVMQKRVSDNLKNSVDLSFTGLADRDTTVQGALVALDVKTGHIFAMVGGKDFGKYQFNRAVQAKRQPGSVFKPIIYTAAIDNGFSVATQLLNQPFVIPQADGTRWAPHNYEADDWTGLMTLRDGLRLSKNVISARLILEIIKKPEVVVDYAHRMGLTTNIEPVYALSLGVSDVILLEMTSAYGIFPNNGIMVKPECITKIIDRRGNVIYEPLPEQKEVLSEQTAYVMTNMLEDVIKSGTGATARSSYGFYRPSGGKTGTTQDFTDAWFIGFTPQIVAGVWIGLDNPSFTLGPRQAGSVAALPIWAKFMKSTHDTLGYKVENFARPEGIVELEICNETKLLATPYCPDVVKEIFIEKYQPTESCSKHRPFSSRPQRRQSSYYPNMQ